MKTFISIIVVIIGIGSFPETETPVPKTSSIVYFEPIELITFESPEIAVPTKRGLSPEQNEWIDALEWCESGGNVNALNPMDLDGTPSHGAFQFKDTTFNAFAALYGIEGELYDRDAQRSIVEYWVLNPGEIVWKRQFPWCVRKLGVPPSPLSDMSLKDSIGR